MPTATPATPSTPQPSRLTRLLNALSGFDLLRWVQAARELLALLKPAKPQPEGMYEVLEYEARLDLKDAQGKRAVYSKRQRVRFLQDNIIAYQDQAWGDGQIFAAYKCAPGVAVDRYREGHRWRILISLRETKNRDDVETFSIQRVIKDGFLTAHEAWQTEIAHTTRRLTVSICFPKQRPPRQITLVEQNAARTTELGPDNLETLPDGRIQVNWRTDTPRLFEAYILRWAW